MSKNMKPEFCKYPDCFHCPYDDCHYNKLEYEDRKIEDDEKAEEMLQA